MQIDLRILRVLLVLPSEYKDHTEDGNVIFIEDHLSGFFSVVLRQGFLC